MRFSGVGLIGAALLLAGTFPGTALGAAASTGLGGRADAGISAATAASAGPAAYQVTSLPGLGGTSSSGQGINDRGWITGFSSLAGNNSQHATLWRGGKITDLGTLGGPNSDVQWPVKNDGGIITGISQTSRADVHRGQPFSCAAFFPTATATGRQCSGFEWKAGVMRALPTLGGPNGFATGSNDKGQVVGWAQDKAHDPTCDSAQMLQFRAVLWGPGKHQLRQLRPLPGDTVSAATAINDRGQAVGISGFCDQAVGRFSAIHAVLWQRGRVISIGTLGGVAWNTPMAINAGGEVVGFSNVSAAVGGSFDAQAFRWTRAGGIRRLGLLKGDSTSQALGVNSHGVVVGTSCNSAGTCQAVIWRRGKIANLNSLIHGFNGTLVTAQDINDSGVITGQAQTSSGALVAFVAHPGS